MCRSLKDLPFCGATGDRCGYEDRCTQVFSSGISPGERCMRSVRHFLISLRNACCSRQQQVEGDAPFFAVNVCRRSAVLIAVRSTPLASPYHSCGTYSMAPSRAAGLATQVSPWACYVSCVFFWQVDLALISVRIEPKPTARI